MSKEQGKPDDQEIAAWLDGELDKDGANRMARLVAADQDVALRADRIRHLDGLVRQAVPQEEIPAGLLERLGLAETPSSAVVIDLDAARLARAKAEKASAGTARRAAMYRIAAQVAFVTALGAGVTLWQFSATRNDAAYHTLSDARRPVPANGVVVFTPGTDVAIAKAIAGSAGAALVGTPNEAGAWKIAIPAGRREAVLASLRRDERVALAEAIDGPTP